MAYVFAETAGRPPADVVVDVLADRRAARGRGGTRRIGSGWMSTAEGRPLAGRTFSPMAATSPGACRRVSPWLFAGEGEWKITLDVFRDLGLAFRAAMVAIYILLVAQMGSFIVPVVVMLAIPLTVLGVMPGFWLLNAIRARACRRVPRSGVLHRDRDDRHDRPGGDRHAIRSSSWISSASLARGRTLFDAIMESRVVRLRPILLTASAAMLGAVPIIIDPIFSGLAWSLIFGLFASTLFTLFVIPVVYWLLYANKPGHGLPMSTMEQEEA